jgi:phosphoserine phosphatase
MVAAGSVEGCETAGDGFPYAARIEDLERVLKKRALVGTKVANTKSAQTGAISRRSILAGAAATVAVTSIAQYAEAQAQPPVNPLPSWNDGPAKQAVLDFTRTTTDQSSKNFVVPEDRIATFDQDGTLWVEHPLYTQAMFALDRVHTLAPQYPEWNSREPFKSVLSGDQEALTKFTERDWIEIVAATHAGMSTEAFLGIVGQWLETAKHPRFKRPYTELVYQPMREVMDYLRVNGFRTYIVSGGGQEFVRTYAQRLYDIPPEQVVGSSMATEYQIKDGKPVLMRLPKLFFDDDHAGKVIGINLFIGKRPYAAFGNSTGDREMLEWTGAGDGARLKMLVYHDDAQREYAYGPAGGLPDTKVGTFDDSLMTEAKTGGWTVISMKNDWRRIFAFE